MNLPDIRKYFNELSGLLKERDGSQGAVEQITALMRAANGAGDHNQQLQLEKQRAAYAKQAAALEAEAIATARSRDVEGARQLQMDLMHRIEFAMNAYSDWRKMVSEYEFSVAHGRFAPEPEEGQAPAGFTRKMADLELDRAKAEVDLRLKHASDAVPERPVLLL